MARSNLNVVMHGASGKVGKLLIFRQRNGQTIIADPPQRRKPLTEKEMAHRERFQEATYLAKKLVADPMFGPLYREKTEHGKGAYTVALADCLSVPKIRNVATSRYKGAIGDVIVVRATDDFMVASVKVQVFSPNGDVVEEGDAVLDPLGFEWVYTATVALATLTDGKAVVKATDIPGNETLEEATITDF